MADAPRETTLQEVLNTGINGFALKLLVESLEDKLTKPLCFQFRGMKFTIEPHPDLVAEIEAKRAAPTKG